MTSTAGDALLSVSDPSSVGTGHLVNGTFVLPEPLQARARNAANTGTAYNNVGSNLNLLTWNGPVSNDAVNIEFSAARQGQRPAAHGHLQQDADVHVVHDQPVTGQTLGAPVGAPAASRTRAARRGS